MSRFFKSAAFPILIVIVLAFFASKLIAHSDQAPAQTFSGFLDAARRGQGPESATLRTKDNSIEVTLKGADKAATRSATRSTTPTSWSTSCAPPRPKGKITDFDVKPARSSVILSLLTYVLPFLIFIGFWIFLMNQVQGGGSKVMSFGKSRAKRHVGGLAEDHVPRRRGRRRGGRGAARDQGVPREPEEVPGARRPHPQGRAALRASGHRQDAARPRRRRRGGRAVLLDLRLGLRRDVRRRRRLARARPVRAGQAELALHHLHGRDRRRGPPPRRRPRRRPRRARADAQPAPRRDGRLRGQGQHHHDRGHQPARHPRSRPAAPRPLRPPDHRRPAGPQGPREDPRGPHARQAAGQGASTSTRSPARRPASPAPTSPTSSTRPPCSPPARARRRSPRSSSKRASCASSPARRRRPG